MRKNSNYAVITYVDFHQISNKSPTFTVGKNASLSERISHANIIAHNLIFLDKNKYWVGLNSPNDNKPT